MSTTSEKPVKSNCFHNLHGQLARISPLTPDRPQVKRPPPLLQITSNFLVLYGLSHGTTLEKYGVAQNLMYSRI